MFEGSIVALVTPMTANGDVDWDALERLLGWHLEQGTAGIVPVGTTGESATLTVPEGTDAAKATRVMEKAEAACMITNSLSADTHLQASVVTGG